MRYPNAECVELEDREPLFWIHLTEAEAQLLAWGTVPTNVSETLADMIRWRIDDPTTWPKRQARTRTKKKARR